MRKIYLRRVSGVTHGESTRMVRPDDFASDIIAAVDAAAQIEDFGRYLPLCVDWRAERLRYSRWEDASPLSDAPFLYQRQRRQAAMLADIPFERLPELGQAEGMTPTFIFSIGRCGSTLLSRMLAAVGEQAVSEPDALTNIALVDNAEQGRQAAEAGELIVRSCVEALRRACGPSPVIKLRAVCNLAAAAFVRALPNARYVFMFRGREDWVRSYSRAFGDSAAELEALLRQSAQAFQHLRAPGPSRSWCGTRTCWPTRPPRCGASCRTAPTWRRSRRHWRRPCAPTRSKAPSWRARRWRRARWRMASSRSSRICGGSRGRKACCGRRGSRACCEGGPAWKLAGGKAKSQLGELAF